MANEKSVDVHVYLGCSKALIEKYGNFKIDAELHNKIIYHLAKICELIEEQLGL